MWELGNLWTHEAGSSNANPVPLASSASSSYLSVMHEIHVLVVDHDSNNLINTANLLESCQYRATISELSSGALQILSSGKVRIDLIMANINSPDLHGFKLLQQAVAMEIPVVLMSSDDNAFTAMRALENGAYVYMKKPPAKEVLKCMWQHVVREKIRAAKERELQLMAANYSGRGVGNPYINNVNSNMLAMDKANSKSGADFKEGYDRQWESHMLNGKVKRKVCTDWTQDLHEKFMHAVETLGDGRCFPKEILELMNVPGLTRMQVASHLQKCRNDNWRSPQERKSMSIAPSSDQDHTTPQKPRRFGLMPKASKTATTKEISGGGNGMMKTSQSEAEMQNDGGVENMETEPAAVVVVMADDNNNNSSDNPPYHPQYGHIVARPGTMAPPALGAYPRNPRNTSEDHFFNFTDMDCLVQNYSGLPVGHVSAGMNTVASSSTAAGGSGYRFEPPYQQLDQQNSSNKVTSVDNRSPWSSETTSNFGSDHDSETKGQSK